MCIRDSHSNLPAGRLLWTRSRDIDNSRSVDISVSNLRPGMYYLNVESKTVRKTAVFLTVFDSTFK